MTSNPYKIEGPALISFSGGRTSGYMLKHIIDAHDEKIFIESELGVGSEFSFTLDQAN